MKKIFYGALLPGLLLLCQACLNSSTGTSGIENSQNLTGRLSYRPYRVLVIIGDQWKDPMSYNINPTQVSGTDFPDVISMLKIWGVPFDILRLDQQRLQINRFLDGEAKPNYGCMIWMADPSKLSGYSANYSVVTRAVKEYGISMIVLSDYIAAEELASLAGIELQGIEMIDLKGEGRFNVSGNHFLTSGSGRFVLPDIKKLAGITIPSANGITPEMPPSEQITEVIPAVRCNASDSVTIIGTVGQYPQITVRDISGSTSVTWIGGGKDWFRKYQVMRGIFRKSLVYSMGYGLFNDNFENGFIFIMDDIGCSEHAWSLRWHYPTPHRDTLIKYLIEPLEKYGFMMVQNITPGFANPEKKLIESPWSVPPFRDIFGNWQDYGSTKEGLDEGLRRGVFEIQAHRAWSHMNWDLDSPPGPWWGSAVDGELALVDWYNEVVDVRRDHNPVPSNDLLFIYRTGIDAIRKTFGVVPLAAEVRPGAELAEGKPGGYDNGRIAAIAGLGVSRECYVGFDYTIEFSMMMPAQFTCHDLDLTAPTNGIADETEENWDKLITLTAEQLMSSPVAGGRRINLRDNLDWLESRKDKHWMGFNETCAYLHSSISRNTGGMLSFALGYDDHYCKYFRNEKSFWTLELSDSFVKRLNHGAKVRIDKKILRTGIRQSQMIEIPEGTGSHILEIYQKEKRWPLQL